MNESFQHLGQGQFPSASEYNRLVDAVSALLRTSHVQYFRDSRGLYVRDAPTSEDSGTVHLAYCKENAPDSDVIDCYFGVDLAAWNAATTYVAGDWVEVAGTEYTSLQDDNLNHLVADTDWWEAGTHSVTVKALIINGTSLMYSEPFLHDGDPVWVQWVNVDDIFAWYITGLPFNGAYFE